MSRNCKAFYSFIFICLAAVCCSCAKDNNTFSDVRKQEDVPIILNQTENFDVSDKFENVQQKDFINEIELKVLLEETDNENLLFWNYSDYDGDKQKEVFAVTGKGDIVLRGNLLFISSGRIDYLGEVSGDSIFVFAVNDSTKFFCVSSEMTENYSRLWGVRDGTAVEMPVSNVGQRFTFDGKSDFKITQSALDGMSLGGGHTHKEYYFYYDHNDKCFYEYGGTEITVKELLQFENGENILNDIADKGGKITSVLKRNNHIINVNYTIPETDALQEFDWNYNITLKINKDSVYVIEENEGVYLPALVPEIAVY